MNTDSINSTVHPGNAKVSWSTWGGLQLELKNRFVIANLATPDQLDEHIQLLQETMKTLDIAVSRATQVQMIMEKYGLPVGDAILKLALLSNLYS